MSSPYEPPRSVMEPTNVSLGDTPLRRDNPPHKLIEGVFSEAWEWVKKRPAETLILSLLTLFFDGNSNGFGDFGGGSTDSDADFGGFGDSFEFFGVVSQGDINGLLHRLNKFLGHYAFFEQEELMHLIDQLPAALLIGAFALGLVFWVIGTFLSGGATIFWLRLIRGQQASFGHVAQVWPLMIPLLVSGLLSGLAQVAGLVLLIIPGVIIALGFWLVTLVIVDRRLTAIEGLRASWQLVNGYKWDLLVFAILIGLLNLVGVLVCCVGVIVTNAVTMGAVVIVFHRLAVPGNAYLTPEERNMGEADQSY